MLVATEICPGIGWNNYNNQVIDGHRRIYIKCLADWLLKKGKVDKYIKDSEYRLNVQKMGKCLHDGGVNMKGYYAVDGVKSEDDGGGGRHLGKN